MADDLQAMNENMQQIKLNPIGIVHTKATDDEVRSRTPDLESTIEIYPVFGDALEGIESFSHIFVIGYFHKLRAEQVGPLKVKPKGLLRYGLKLEDLPLLGVFSLDSPTRPNPIGLSLVPLLRIVNKTNVVVSNLDYFDGTPVLDLKPYQASYRTESFRVPDWHRKLLEKVGRV
jgi:tRNA-Thr(GGU) m(6)t(6)A37 methyltransferase TsaA